jgi:outer membrane protein OmpA-like peptidoglycan-associated protein
MRSFLIALLSILWLILGWIYCRDYHRCCSGEKTLPGISTNAENAGPILFSWGSNLPVLGTGWPRMRDSLALLATDSTSLEIAGWYCQNASPEETESTGLARAEKVRVLIPDIPDERIILVTRMVTCDSSYRNSAFESVSFARRIRTQHIKEIDNTTIIYFPPNSTQKLNNKEVEAYLDNVVARVTKSGERVQLTGHTDDDGPVDENLILGQKRADTVKTYLIKKGVPEKNVISTSKGESMPIADNGTPEGRAKNRRTELQIIK